MTTFEAVGGMKAVAALALLLVAPAGLADQWQFNPRAEVGAQADDNYLMLPPDGATSVSGGFGDVLLEFRDVGEVNEFRFAPGVYATYFPSSKEFQSTDPYAALELAHHGLTSTARLVADYTDQSTVNSERLSSDVSNAGLGNPIGGDSGYLAIHNRRQFIYVGPSFTTDLSPRNHMTLAVNYYDAAYDKYIPNTYVSYQSVLGAVGWAHDLTERTSVTVRAVYSQYRPDATSGSNNGGGLEGEWKNRVSNTAEAYVRLGVQQTRFDQVAPGNPDRTTSYTGGAGINWAFRASQLFLDLTQTVDPNASGYTVERSQLRGRLTRNFTPTALGYLGARAFKDRAQETGTSFNDRWYAVGTVGFEWRFLRAWTLVAEYNYTRQKYANDAEAARSNQASLSFVFEPHRDISAVRHNGHGRGP